ncbi:MAG: hypothetical protein Q7S12_02595 [bacterium]|nr:hypothetical protein [bacterium]
MSAKLSGSFEGRKKPSEYVAIMAAADRARRTTCLLGPELDVSLATESHHPSLDVHPSR